MIVSNVLILEVKNDDVGVDDAKAKEKVRNDTDSNVMILEDKDEDVTGNEKISLRRTNLAVLKNLPRSRRNVCHHRRRRVILRRGM